MTNPTASVVSIPFQVPGDLVQIKPQCATKAFPAGEVWIIDTVPGFGGRATKTSAHALLDPTRKVKADPRAFMSFSDAAWVGSRDEAELRAREVKAPEVRMLPGLVFRHIKEDGLFVLTGDTAGKWRASPLGGSTRYLRGLTASVIAEVIDPARVTIAP